MSTINLYDYQKTATEKVINFWRKGKKRGVLVSPTSSGKTVMAAELINKFVNSGKKVLFLVHLEDLIESTFRALNGLNVKGLSKITAQTTRIDNTKMCYVSMVQTFKSRLKNEIKKKPYENLLQNVGLIVFDEVHLNFFNEFLLNDLISNTFMLGMSATPKRSGKNTPQLANLFNFKVNTITEIELIKRGFTVPPNVFTSSYNIDLTHVKTSKISGEDDYNSNDLFTQIDKRQVYDNAIELYKENALNKQTLVFTTNIEHAIKTCKEFNNNGIKAKFITSEPSQGKPTQKDYSLKQKKYQFYTDNYLLYSGNKDKILDQWNNKEFDVLVNAGIFTTGYDNASIECVILLRATLSENLYLQMCGRGKRKKEGKKQYILIDCASNIEAFGLPTQPRNYSLEHKVKKGKGEAPTKTCPECKNKVFASSKVCGQFNPKTLKTCFHVFEYQKNIISGDFQNINLAQILSLDNYSLYKNLKNIDVLDFDKVAEKKQYTEKWKYYQIFENHGKNGLFEYAVKKQIEPNLFLEKVKNETNLVF